MNATVAESLPASRMFEALDYEAPFLIEKLVKDRIVETSEEAEAVFLEVKRYIIIAAQDPTKSWHMYSLRIDECWHQFILFTRQYMAFCKDYFGRYIPHSPSNAPEIKSDRHAEMTTLPQFSARYEELFDTPLPGIWDDTQNVTANQRLLNDHIGKLSLRDEDGMVDLLGPSGGIVMSVNDLAKEALDFITRTGAFHVRELPGDLDDEEKIALVVALMQCKLLRAAF